MMKMKMYSLNSFKNNQQVKGLLCDNLWVSGWKWPNWMQLPVGGASFPILEMVHAGMPCNISP